MLTEPITVERDGYVLLIGVNRPAKRNAFDLATIEALGAAYETLGTDDELRAGVLFAYGDHFSAGLDLAEAGPAVAGSGPGAIAGSHRFDPFAVWGEPVPKPVVLAVNGMAYTLSIELALAADIVVAADDCASASGDRPRDHAVRRRHVPCARAARLGNAMRFLLTARNSVPPRRCGSGWSRKSCRPGRTPRGAGTGPADRPAGTPRGTGTLANARIGRSQGPDAAREHIASLLPGILRSQDAAEGLRSSAERREARFTGR